MLEAPLLGRGRELDLLQEGLRELAAGEGGLFFLCGEPGIGKSRLAEELARRAAQRGVDVLWGRAWEAGGAPAYWPWIQVLRALELDTAGAALLDGLPRARIAPLGALLPELGARLEAGHDTRKLAPEHARFAVLDAVCAVLAEAARKVPRLVVLEDLHAADPASLELLDFLNGQKHRAPLAVLGTYRDADAARAPAGALLQRVAGRARTFALRPLTAEEVAQQLEQTIGAAPSAELAHEVHAATEGNPLFVVETARLIAARRLEPGRIAIPNSVRAAIRERLARLAPETRAALEAASVIGREFPRATLARMTDREDAELIEPLADAADAAILLETAPGQYRFAHILFREVLHQDLARDLREALHLALAHALEADPKGAPLSELAHHYLEAGTKGRDRAVEAATRAAEQAQAQFAFGEAARLYRLALSALELAAPQGDSRTTELLLELGRAQLLAGEQAEAQASCMAAAERARRAGDAATLARAALAYGSVFVAGKVDPELVALLREALARLGDEQPALRARVMARLAAAEQPAPDPEQPIALARRAIALAREQRDPAVLLDVIRAGCSAMIDVGDPEERAALTREHVALADALSDRTEMLRGTVRLSFDCYELGDVPAARAAIDRAERIAAELGHPHYPWRIACLQAMRAAFAGHFDEAERELARARSLGERAGDLNVQRTLLLQRVGLLRQQGRVAELEALIPETRSLYAAEPATLALTNLIEQSARARTGDPRVAYPAADFELALAQRDQTLFEMLAELCHALHLPETAERVLQRAPALRDRMVHGGMFGMTWDGPGSRVAALLYATCGRHEEARRSFEHALARVQEIGSRAHLAWVALDYGRFLRELGERERAAELLATARELGRELHMPGVLEALERSRVTDPGRAPLPAAPSAATAPAVPRVAYFHMERDGELWRITCEGASFHLKDGKGLRMLAELVREPGRELHVLELSEPGGASDTGDAGEALDAKARAAYRARVEHLREIVAEAEAQNDLGRAERARHELELLTRELARAVGLSGRDRKAGAAVERARVNVQRRLRDAIRRIGEHHAELEKHLEWAVRTGTFCCYDPG